MDLDSKDSAAEPGKKKRGYHMKLHFENFVTVMFFIVSLLILAPACSNVAQVIGHKVESGETGHSVIVNP
jgi:hypothetical protein